MGRLGKQPALVIELQEQEKSLVIIPTSSSIEWIDWLVSVDQYIIFHKRQGRRSFQSHMYDVSVHSSWAGFTCLYVYSLMTFFFSVWCLKRKIWRKGSGKIIDIESILRWPFLPLPLMYLTSRSLGLCTGWRKNNSSRAKEDLTSVGDSCSWTALLEGS